MIALYHSPRTRSLRVLWLLEELGLPYELHTLAFTPDSLKGADYLKVNPLGKVPSITDGELTMFESGAIVEYLLERYGNGRLAPKVGTAERGAFLQWVHFAEATCLPPLSDLAQHTIFKPETERIAALVPDAQARIATWLGVLERAAAGKQYLLGDDFTGADVMIGYSLLLTKWFGLLGEPPYANLSAYLARLERRPALQKALSA
jgi:glutathione S-transferase